MKAKVGKNAIVFSTESEFEVAALKQWEGREATVCIETYQHAGFYTGGFLKVHFKIAIDENKPIKSEEQP